MIESWEIERHEANSDQSGRDWCDATDTNGKTMRFDRVLFPYDIGIFANMSQAMGTANAVMWLWPFSSGPKLDKSGKGVGWRWEENGFNDTEGMWPPMNPERLRKKNRQWPLAQRDFAAELRDVERTPEERISAFRKRQAQDTQRRLKLSRKVEEVEFEDYNEGSFEDRDVWTNTNGERLEDFGVDLDAMGYSGSRTSDENLPLAEVLRRRTMPRKPEI
ncbi:palmitoyltransferase pfa4 [Moelleriella libera RCEF 2490]|uniref:Palmitoyltransferase pfa4 n=1 Tax=Moelleriella libera RCEF 2490 TaxID=1081109 RepID=A0A162IAJ3_9HYPO|nr:palmitoyltransferase pfa4 [Moelleriella libera RCEF 2490]